MRHTEATNLQSFLKVALDRIYTWIDRYGLNGYDPYDGLNSKFFQALPFKPRILRLAWIQFFKRCPVNLRKILLVPKTRNSKGLALLVDGLLFQYQIHERPEYKERTIQLLQLLEKDSIPGFHGFCWGYPFDWQSRLDFKPKGTPTVVTTAFVANAFLHAYSTFGNEEYLNIARSACDFILKDLNRHVDGDGFCFSYSPFDQAVVHNANMLAAHLLAKVYGFTGEYELIEAAQKSVGYVINHQNADGSWFYGAAPFQQWIDHFHTGFVLEFLHDYIKLIDSVELLKHLESGLDFYLKNLFLPDGRPKYYAHKTYPIDIHCCAQAMLTLSQLQELNPKCRRVLEKVLQWTIEYMQSPQGYFYYQKFPWFTIKIPYLRWGQAWMFKALSFLFMKQKTTDQESHASMGSDVVAKQ